ncbi:hypothetical protein [Actinomadura bangladeshensis]|uniref:Uncharacterized protein n=1 Tax=Actinomadura bangladeshensis TaxID=453573 RepID=A0A4R4NIA9_9ACTN|nr:hypothetical protein [Actinomadura bangladeshensis]TDC09088.1 hypothetical protein E1284_30085 [Actinomadura bangladeshensis]
MELDSGLPVLFKCGITAMATVIAGLVFCLLRTVMAGGPVWKTFAIVMSCLSVWLWLQAVLGMFRYRVWLDGTTLCIQKSFRVLRTDLATATWVGVEYTHTGVLFLSIRGSRGRLLLVRMMTAEGRLVPQHQVEAVADAIAARLRRTRCRRGRHWPAWG